MSDVEVWSWESQSSERVGNRLCQTLLVGVLGVDINVGVAQ